MRTLAASRVRSPTRSPLVPGSPWQAKVHQALAIGQYGLESPATTSTDLQRTDTNRTDAFDPGHGRTSFVKRGNAVRNGNLLGIVFKWLGPLIQTSAGEARVADPLWRASFSISTEICWIRSERQTTERRTIKYSVGPTTSPPEKTGGRPDQAVRRSGVSRNSPEMRFTCCGLLTGRHFNTSTRRERVSWIGHSVEKANTLAHRGGFATGASCSYARF
jgi:hypothetical protein